VGERVHIVEHRILGTWKSPGCKWRGLPKQFCNQHIYTRMDRWTKSGCWDRSFAQLQRRQIIGVKIEVVALDRTLVKVHPDGTGALKTGQQAIGQSRGEGRPRRIWLPRMLERF
jgi:hypothetical protein